MASASSRHGRKEVSSKLFFFFFITIMQAFGFASLSYVAKSTMQSGEHRKGSHYSHNWAKFGGTAALHSLQHECRGGQ